MCRALSLSAQQGALTAAPSMSSARAAVPVYASAGITEPAAMASACFRARGYSSGVPGAPKAEGQTESNRATLTVTGQGGAPGGTPPGPPPLRGPQGHAGGRGGLRPPALPAAGLPGRQLPALARCPGAHAACPTAMLALCGPLTPCRPPGGHHCGARSLPRPVVPAGPAGRARLGPGPPVGVRCRGHRVGLPGRRGDPRLLRRAAQAALSRTSFGYTPDRANNFPRPSGRIRRMSAGTPLSAHGACLGDGKSVTCSADTALSRTGFGVKAFPCRPVTVIPGPVRTRPE